MTKKLDVGDYVYVKVMCRVEEIHQEWGNRSGLQEWLTVSDPDGNTWDVDRWEQV